MRDAGASPVGLMFGRIAPVYDFLNHALSAGIDRRWRKELAALVLADQTGIVPDLCAGTLDVALAVLAAHPEAIIPALDFCPLMLARGLRKLKTRSQKKNILPAAADVLALPLPDNHADSLTMAFGIRNIPPRARALEEMLRVLRPGGRACILEFGSGREKIWGGLYNFHLFHILPLVGRLIARDKAAYSYLANTIRNFPAAPDFAREMESAGFRDVHYRKLTSGIVCLHWGHKPSG